MASICIPLTLTVAIISIGSAEAGGFPYLQCNKETLGHHGSQSLLECVVKSPYDDTEIRGITWEKASQILLKVIEGVVTVGPVPGYSYVQPSSWVGRNMTVSLIITNTEVKHNGSYGVTVWTTRGRCPNSITLQVTAKYIQPTFRRTPEGRNCRKGDNLTCVSDGGYPEGKLRWFDGDKELTDASQTDTNQAENGLFQLSSVLSLRDGCSGFNYTCRVFNFKGDREQETPYPMPDHFQPEGHGQRKELDPATKIVAPLVVIGSLIAGLLIAMLVYRRRRQKARRPSTAPLMGDHVEVPREDNGGDMENKDGIA